MTAALSEIDAKRIVISDLETRLMTQSARGDDFERALGERHSELSDERKRLTALAKNLTAEQERGLILEQHIREIVRIGQRSSKKSRVRDSSLRRPLRSSFTAETDELRPSVSKADDETPVLEPLKAVPKLSRQTWLI